MNVAENNKKTRLFEISLLNVFFCLLVVFVHASSKTVTDLDKSSWQYLAVMVPWRLSTFVVQGFIFLSGLKLFLNKSNGIAYGKFFAGRVRYIVLPYIAWVFIYYVYFCANDYFSFNLSDFCRYVLVGNLVSPFYFVIVIIQFYLLTPLWLRLIKKTDSAVLIVFSLMITVILGQNLPNIINLFFSDVEFRYTDRVFTTYLVYWVAGCYAGLYYEKFKEILHKNRMIISIVFLAVSFCNAALSYLSFSGKRTVYWLENVHIMYCICAILFFYAISLLFSTQSNTVPEKPQKFKTGVVGFINSIDKISYGIFLAHSLVIFMINDFLAEFQGISIGVSYFIRLGTTYIITVGVLLIWNSIKKRVTLMRSKQ